MNLETEEEKSLLNEYAVEIAEHFDNYWSIDFSQGQKQANGIASI